MFFGCPARGEKNGIRYKERQLVGVLYIPLVPPEALAALHLPLLPTPSPNESPAKRVSFGKGGTRSSVDVAVQARPHDLMALFGRNKRYNTLDLASKIVCQRRASPPSFGNRPGTGRRIFSREIETLMPVFIFPRVPQKCKTVFVTAGENEKSGSRLHERMFNPTRFWIDVLDTQSSNSQISQRNPPAGSSIARLSQASPVSRSAYSPSSSTEIVRAPSLKLNRAISFSP